MRAGNSGSARRGARTDPHGGQLGLFIEEEAFSYPPRLGVAATLDCKRRIANTLPVVGPGAAEGVPKPKGLTLRTFQSGRLTARKMLRLAPGKHSSRSKSVVHRTWGHVRAL